MLWQELAAAKQRGDLKSHSLGSMQDSVKNLKAMISELQKQNTKLQRVYSSQHILCKLRNVLYGAVWCWCALLYGAGALCCLVLVCFAVWCCMVLVCFADVLSGAGALCCVVLYGAGALW